MWNMMASESACSGMGIEGEDVQLMCNVHGLCVPTFCSNPTIGIAKTSRNEGGFGLGPE